MDFKKSIKKNFIIFDKIFYSEIMKVVFMIESLYKFMPFRESFFENFLLRASHFNSLNDPFEMEPSIEWWVNIFLEIKHYRFGETKEEITSYIKNQNYYSPWRHLGTDLFKEHGIISFTETKNNILMWSHYSNNHTGLVVEFDIKHSFFNKKFKEKDKKYEGTPQKVLYRKDRLKSSNYLLEPFFHKSLEWMYEQEYRMLLPLHKRDKILIHNNHCNDEFIKNGVQSSSNGEFKKLNKNFLEIKNSYNTSLINNKNTMFMFKVPPNAIKSVYLGCKISKENKDKLINLLKKESLNHIKVFQSIINDNNYELDFIEEPNN